MRAPWRRRSTRTWCSPAAAARMRCSSPLLLCNPGASGTMHPGYRNEFHAGLQQALGKICVFNGEYIWKYTHNAFDFSVLGNTPITFPIDWHNSKIPGYAMNVEVPTVPRFQRLFCHLVGGGALLPAAGGWSRSHQRRGRWHPISLPHRPRREVQRNHPRAIPDSRRQVDRRAVGWLQLALRQRSGCGIDAVLQRDRSQQHLRGHIDPDRRSAGRRSERT